MEEIVVDPNSLTLGEIEDVEEYAGKPAAELFGDGGMTAKAMTAFVWIVKRRDDPTFTVEQARAMPMGQVNIASAEPDPTDAASSES